MIARNPLSPFPQVIAQFDVYFPGKMIPCWKFMLLSILTLGLYAIYFYCIMYFRSKGCCLPTSIDFERGRLLVTSHGRILTWKTYYEQVMMKPKIPLKYLFEGP
jgi:hypothetical protein